MKKNPWHDIKPGEYDAHMGHPNVGQTQILSQIIREQFELIPATARPISQVGILGITNGNGLEHVIPSGIGWVIGIDINQDFLHECKKRFSVLKERLCLQVIDLVAEAVGAAGVLAQCDLIIANLIIEHIHLEAFSKIIHLLPKHGQIVSCVIQVNPDGALASASGVEHVFDSVVAQVEEENEAALTASMQENGYSLKARAIYNLPNGKQFIRLDYAAMK